MKNTYKAFAQNVDWLRVTGSDAIRFLQGMWTADIKRASTLGVGSSGSAYLLDVKGRPVSPAIFVYTGPNEFLFALPAGRAQPTLEALDHLLVADDVKLEIPNPAPFAKVWQVWVGSDQSSFDELAHAAAVPDAKDRLYRSRSLAGGWWIPTRQMGSDHVQLWLESGIAAPAHFQEISSEEFTLKRIEEAFPLWDKDYGPESLLLEFPVADSISFYKGCYIGQEVIARGTYRGTLPKVFCRFEGEEPLIEDFVYGSTDPDRPLGKITSASGRKGLGGFRLRGLAEAPFFQRKPDGSLIKITRVEPLVAASQKP